MGRVGLLWGQAFWHAAGLLPGVAQRRSSGNNLLHYPPADVRQPKLASLEQIRQLLVVDSQKVQNGGLQIQNVTSAFRHIESVVVRAAVDVAGLDAAAAHP